MENRAQRNRKVPAKLKDNALASEPQGPVDGKHICDPSCYVCSYKSCSLAWIQNSLFFV